MRERDEGKSKRKKEKKKKKRERGLKERNRDQTGRWKGLFVKNRKERRVAARCRGWEQKTARGNQGKTLGFEVRWAWAGFGLLSRSLKFIFLLQFNLAKIIWQFIFKNGDDCLGKIFSDNFSKNKIGFNKNNFG